MIPKAMGNLRACRGVILRRDSTPYLCSPQATSKDLLLHRRGIQILDEKADDLLARFG
jgi:hypothetical protein